MEVVSRNGSKADAASTEKNEHDRGSAPLTTTTTPHTHLTQNGFHRDDKELRKTKKNMSEETLSPGDQEESPVESKFIFTDDSHQSRILQSINMMRKNRTFCDVIFHIGNTELHGHRAVLASASPYFLELFTAEEEGNKGTQRESTITYKLNGGFNQDALEKLMEFAYTSRLEVDSEEVRSVYLTSRYLKMDSLSKECAKYLIKNLTVENCIEIRSLPGIARNKTFVNQVDLFIADNFTNISTLPMFLALPCVCIEVLNQTREEMSLVSCDSLCHLVVDWMKRLHCEDEPASVIESLTKKTHMLYLALDNSLQDCSELPSGDVSDTEIVQDYKRMTQKDGSNPSAATARRKVQKQPAKPRVLIYYRDVDKTETEKESDWMVIGAHKVGEHTFLALATLSGRLASLSIMLRLNQPAPLSPDTVNGSLTKGNSYSNGIDAPPDMYCALANMTARKCAAGCANLNNNLFVCGGYDRADCIKSVESYNPDENIWETLKPMREARGRFDIAVVNGKVYAVGGCDGLVELSTVECYDADEKKWTPITSLSLARSNIGVCDLDGKIYCVGGWNGQVGIKQCDVYDPASNQWESIAPLNTGRYQAGVCALNGCVYAAGGCEAWNCLSSVECYDPVADTWTYSKPMITARRGCGLAVFKGKLYIVGGSDGTHSLSTTEIFDPTDGSCTPGPSMTTPRANVGVAVIGDKLWAVGGYSGKSFLNTIEYLDSNTDEWTQFGPKQNSVSSSPSSFTLENGLNTSDSSQKTEVPSANGLSEVS